MEDLSGPGAINEQGSDLAPRRTVRVKGRLTLRSEAFL